MIAPSTDTAGGKKSRAPKPVTVVLTGELAAAIRASAKESRRTPQQVAETYLEYGCDRPAGDTGRMFIEIPSGLRESLERIARAGGYEDGVVELALETMIPDHVILDGAATTIIRTSELDRMTMAHLAVVTMEEKIRHSEHYADKWITEHVLGGEVTT